MKNEVKICAISDTHGALPNDIEKCDILLIGGDLDPATNHNRTFQQTWIYNNFIPWAKAKIDKGIVGDLIFVCGNHDFYFESLMKKDEEEVFRSDLPEHIHYLRDSMVEIQGIKIYGTPWTPSFGNWAFMTGEQQLDEIFSKIPENIDIILSHGPAEGYSDCIEQEMYNVYTGRLTSARIEHLGSSSLIHHIERVRPEWVFTGHIHSGNHNVTEKYVDGQVIKFACVSILDEHYDVFYTPFKLKYIK